MKWLLLWTYNFEMDENPNNMDDRYFS